MRGIGLSGEPDENDKTDTVGERVEGKSYMMSGSPHERIDRLVHETLYDLLRRAAADIRAGSMAATATGQPPD